MNWAEVGPVVMVFIAESVLHHLATHVQSLGFFATHYGTLGLSFKTHPQIKQLRMGIVVDSGSRNITFYTSWKQEQHLSRLV